jgi:hypothetical protein
LGVAYFWDILSTCNAKIVRKGNKGHRRARLAVSIAFVLEGCSGPIPSLQPQFKVLIFSKTVGIRHDSIPADPRGVVHVLLTLDESTYSGGTMGPDHPLAWCQTYDGGRSWYTENGHTKETYYEMSYKQHVLAGIQYAAGVVTDVVVMLRKTEIRY